MFWLAEVEVQSEVLRLLEVSYASHPENHRTASTALSGVVCTQ
jgi:hypothetical protein